MSSYGLAYPVPSILLPESKINFVSLSIYLSLKVAGNWEAVNEFLPQCPTSLLLLAFFHDIMSPCDPTIAVHGVVRGLEHCWTEIELWKLWWHPMILWMEKGWTTLKWRRYRHTEWIQTKNSNKVEHDLHCSVPSRSTLFASWCGCHCSFIVLSGDCHFIGFLHCHLIKENKQKLHKSWRQPCLEVEESQWMLQLVNETQSWPPISD